MSEEKQIEEMAKAMHDGCSIVKATNQCCGEDCLDCGAITLYQKGYCKASDVAREIFAEIEKYMIPLEKWFLAMRQQNQDCSEEYWNGKWSAFMQLRDFINTNIKAKYTKSEDAE